MPTYTFTRTREQLRDMVLRKLRVLAAGESASPEDATIVYEAMDLRLKELHAKNALWFNVSSGATDLLLTGRTATANAPAGMLFPLTVKLRISGEDQDIDLITNSEYQDIPNKDDTGEPVQVVYSGGVFRFWPVPAMDYTAKITFQKVAADTATATAPDLRPEMMRAFRNILAYDLADDFGMAEGTIVRLKLEADEGMRTILALAAPRIDNTPVTPEYF